MGEGIQAGQGRFGGGPGSEKQPPVSQPGLGRGRPEERKEESGEERERHRKTDKERGQELGTQVLGASRDTETREKTTKTKPEMHSLRERATWRERRGEQGQRALTTQRRTQEDTRGTFPRGRERPWAAPPLGRAACLLDSGKEAVTAPIWKLSGPSRMRALGGSQT